MGLFDAFEGSVEDIPVGFGLPNGEYEVQVAEVNLVDKKNGGQAVVIKYAVLPGHPLAGKTQDQWLTVPVAGDKNAGTFASFLKQGLMNIGVPEGMLAEFDPTDPEHVDGVIGNVGILSIRPQKSNPKYQDIRFHLEENSGATPEPSGVSDVQVPSNAQDKAAVDEEFDLSKFGV